MENSLKNNTQADAKALDTAPPNKGGALANISILEQLCSAFPPLLEPSEKFKAAPLGELRLVRTGEEEELTGEKDFKTAAQKGSASRSKNNNTEQAAKIAFSFQDYLRAIQKLQIFQKTNDKEAYQEWLERQGQEGARLFIALRKWEKRNPNAGSELLQNKYIELAQGENGITAEQVRNLHQYIKCFAEMQLLLSRFSQTVRNQSKDMIQGVQAIWPDLKSILDGEWLADLMLSRLEVPILKISNLNTQTSIKRLLAAFFKKAEMISRQHLNPHI